MSIDSAKHTPGQWFSQGKHVRYCLHGFTTSELLADCDTESTARLIVEMLSALKAVIASATPNEKEHPTMFAAWKQAEAVITKAEKI